jgi:hypothetical protein
MDAHRRSTSDCGPSLAATKRDLSRSVAANLRTLLRTHRSVSLPEGPSLIAPLVGAPLRSTGKDRIAAGAITVISIARSLPARRA